MRQQTRQPAARPIHPIGVGEVTRNNRRRKPNPPSSPVLEGGVLCVTRIRTRSAGIINLKYMRNTRGRPCFSFGPVRASLGSLTLARALSHSTTRLANNNQQSRLPSLAAASRPISTPAWARGMPTTTPPSAWCCWWWMSFINATHMSSHTGMLEALVEVQWCSNEGWVHHPWRYTQVGYFRASQRNMSNALEFMSSR